MCSYAGHSDNNGLVVIVAGCAADTVQLVPDASLNAGMANERRSQMIRIR